MARTSTKKLRVIVLAAFFLPALVRASDLGSPPEKFEINLPAGISRDLWAYFVPRENPLSVKKVRLGAQLFFDKRLSADGSLSCSSCHDPRFAFADGKKVAEGIGGRHGARNSPTLLNAMFNVGQFWDGRAQSLEEQAIMPLVNPDEMGNESHGQVVARLKQIPEYSKQFQEVFGETITIDLVAKAIAAFERTLVSANSPLDRFVAGDRTALGESAQRGFLLFRGKARCSVCHTLNQSFPFLTDQNYRNTGVAANNAEFEPLTRRAMELARNTEIHALSKAFEKQKAASELGRFLITGNALDIGAFRTPSLRDVELTAPYFHDGSAATLQEVVRFYVRGGNDNPIRDWELQAVNLTDREQEDLIEFLKSLTSDDARRLTKMPAEAYLRSLLKE